MYDSKNILHTTNYHNVKEQNILILLYVIIKIKYLTYFNKYKKLIKNNKKINKNNYIKLYLIKDVKWLGIQFYL